MGKMAQLDRKRIKILPHLLIIAIFIVISCVFCYPAFQGKVILQGDFFTWRYMAREIFEYHLATGANAFWMNNAFSGMPGLMTKLFTGADWFNELRKFLLFGKMGHPENPAIYFFWAMLSFYILMTTLKVNKWLGMFGALAFVFSSYNPIIIAAGHTTKMQDIAYLPAIIAGVLLVYRGKYWLGIIVTGIFLAFFLSAGHYQIIYYGSILIGIIGVAKLTSFIKEGQVKKWLLASAVLLVIAGLSFATQAVHILPVEKYISHSIRGGNSELKGEMHSKRGGLGKDYAFQWSSGIGETFCILVPNLYGGASGEDIGADSHYGKTLTSLGVPPQQVSQMTMQAPLYWGPQPFLSGPVYFGAVICLLTILAFLVIKSPMKWWLGGAALFFILLALGKSFSSFNFFMFDYFPFLNKFRTPSMALSMPSIIFPLLAIWALRDIFKENINSEELLKKVKVALVIVGGLCVLILITTFMFMDFKGASDAQILQMAGNKPDIGQQLVNAIHADRASAARTDAFRSLVFVLLAAGVLWLFAKGKIKKKLVIAGLGLLICIDEIPVAHRYLNDNNFIDDYKYEQQYQPRTVDLKIMKDKDLSYRVMDLTQSPFNDAKTSYFHNSVGGYHPAKLESYQELIENQLSHLNSAVLDMLNTRYLIFSGQQGNPESHKNPNACGAAWFVSDIKWAKDAKEAMDDLDAPSLQKPNAELGKIPFNPLKTAILRDSLKPRFSNYNIAKDSNASITVKKYSPDTLIYETNNSQNGLAVFSEIYYSDGWKATIDGKEADILRTNFVLRAVKVPAGKHKVVFTFTLPGYKEGATISYIGSILLTLLILTSIVALVLKYKKEEKESGVKKAKK